MYSVLAATARTESSTGEAADAEMGRVAEALSEWRLASTSSTRRMASRVTARSSLPKSVRTSPLDVRPNSDVPTASSSRRIVRESADGLTCMASAARWMLSYSPTIRKAGSQFHNSDKLIARCTGDLYRERPVIVPSAVLVVRTSRPVLVLRVTWVPVVDRVCVP